MTNDTLTRPAGPPSSDPRDRIVRAMSTAPARRRRRIRVAVVAFLSFGVVAYALSMYLGANPSDSVIELRPDVPWHYPMLLTHILTGALALALGPLQFVRRIRRVPRVHRYIGRAYLFAGVLPSSVAGIVAASLTTAGPIAGAGLAVGDVLWFTTAVLAYRAARQRRYRDHGEWMIRNFALTFAAVTFRVWLGLLTLGQLPILESVHGGDFDSLFDTAYNLTCWLAFIPNLVVAHLYVRAGHRARRAGASQRVVTRA